MVGRGDAVPPPDEVRPNRAAGPNRPGHTIARRVQRSGKGEELVLHDHPAARQPVNVVWLQIVRVLSKGARRRCIPGRDDQGATVPHSGHLVRRRWLHLPLKASVVPRRDEGDVERLRIETGAVAAWVARAHGAAGAVVEVEPAVPVGRKAAVGGRRRQLLDLQRAAPVGLRLSGRHQDLPSRGRGPGDRVAERVHPHVQGHDGRRHGVAGGRDLDHVAPLQHPLVADGHAGVAEGVEDILPGRVAGRLPCSNRPPVAHDAQPDGGARGGQAVHVGQREGSGLGRLGGREVEDGGVRVTGRHPLHRQHPIDGEPGARQLVRCSRVLLRAGLTGVTRGGGRLGPDGIVERKSGLREAEGGERKEPE